MFHDFTAGGVDITDWPVSPLDLNCTFSTCFQNNPDFFLTTTTNQLAATQGQSELDIYQLDVNNNVPFLGIPMLQTRAPGNPGASVTSSTTGCSAGYGKLVVSLKNLEENNALIVDSLNTVSATPLGQTAATATVHDSDNGPVDGVYTVPSSGCMLQGNYVLATSMYSGTAGIGAVGATVSSVDFFVNYNSPSTMKPTPASIEVRKALAHLIDKPSFILNNVVSGLATYDDTITAPAQGLSINGVQNSKLPQSVIDEDCAQHPWFNPGSCRPVSAYNLVSDYIGANGANQLGGSQNPVSNSGYSGYADLRAACDHFVNAGLNILPPGSTCDNVANGKAYLDRGNGHISFRIGTERIRKAFGQILADSLNFLFGTWSSKGGGTVCYMLVAGCVSDPLFKDNPFYFSLGADAYVVSSQSSADENLWTGYHQLELQPTQLGNYQSKFAGNICGGPMTPYLSNYMFWCDPAYDTQILANPSSASDYQSLLGAAALIAYRKAMSIPIQSDAGITFAALNGWNFQKVNPNTQSSLVNVQGHEFGAGYGYWPFLNMRQVPGFVPSNQLFVPGGGNSALIRRGLSQQLTHLNPFQSATPWEYEILSQIYDSMLKVSPLTTSGSMERVDWMTKSHTVSYDPFEVSCMGSNCVTGTTTQTWSLRNDVVFHDGIPLVADDVVYTILAYRNVPAFLFYPSVSTVSSAVAIDSRTVQVKLQGANSNYEFAIGSIPILPKHVWAPICGNLNSNPPSSTSQCYSNTFDPMQAGLMIGSGPWVCRNLNTGALGGSCTQNGDSSIGTQTVSPGGRVLLSRNSGYMRCCSDVQGPTSRLWNLSFADRDNDGLVDVLDIADAAFWFGKGNNYWANPVAGCSPPPGFDEICVVSTVAFYFGHGIITPYTPSQLGYLDPQVDPFFCPSTGC
jgi:ABC-type transport system substrate-binding protein